MSRQLAASCEVEILDFAMPVAFGSVAGLLAGIGARKLMDGSNRDKTKDAMAHVINAATFTLVAGLTFVLRQRRPH